MAAPIARWVKHYTHEWLLGTAHMSLACQGAFMRLLDHAWMEEGIEANPRKMSRLLGISEEDFDALWDDGLSDEWAPGKDGRLHNPKQERIRAEQVSQHESRSRGGKMGAASRWHSSAIDSPNGKPMEGIGNRDKGVGKKKKGSAEGTTSPVAPAPPLWLEILTTESWCQTLAGSEPFLDAWRGYLSMRVESNKRPKVLGATATRTHFKKALADIPAYIAALEYATAACNQGVFVRETRKAAPPENKLDRIQKALEAHEQKKAQHGQ